MATKKTPAKKSRQGCTFLIDDKTKAKLNRLAKAQELSKSDVIRGLILAA